MDDRDEFEAQVLEEAARNILANVKNHTSLHGRGYDQGLKDASAALTLKATLIRAGVQSDEESPEEE